MSDTVVELAPILAVAAPFLVAIGNALIGGAALWVAHTAHRWAGQSMTQDQEDALRTSVQKDVEDAAGSIWADAEAGIATQSIKVSDPRIASAAASIVAAAPTIVSMFGLTPEAVQADIQAALGRLQAQAPPPAPVVPSVPALPAPAPVA